MKGPFEEVIMDDELEKRKHSLAKGKGRGSMPKGGPKLNKY